MKQLQVKTSLNLDYALLKNTITCFLGVIRNIDKRVCPLTHLARQYFNV